MAAVVASGRITTEKWIKLGGYFFVCVLFSFLVLLSATFSTRARLWMRFPFFCVSKVPHQLLVTTCARATLGLIVLDCDIRWERDVVKGY